ncbi:MAG: nitrous oxide reductase family maturation protein NosD, partial [Candidatus Hermodarchaeota archaeon]
MRDDSESSHYFNLESTDPNLSAVSGKIHIDDGDPGSNWSVAKSLGICSGNGTYSEPYLIEDLVIDGGGSENCIFIENSEAFFKIKNCTVYNSTGDDRAGIRLLNAKNGILINNNCSNNHDGIFLRYSQNITISVNTANNNLEIGLYISYSPNNIVSENIANNNSYDGILLHYSDNNSITGNTASFNDEYGIVINHCDNGTIKGNTVINNYRGIELYNSNNHTVSFNSANNNSYGINLYYSPGNIVSNNTLQKNVLGINIDHTCENNIISGNALYECGISFLNPCWTFTALTIDDTNTVNGRKVYFYKNRINLRADSFTNAGQVILFNCSNSIISNLNTSYCTSGISLYYCENNEILIND